MATRNNMPFGPDMLVELVALRDQINAAPHGARRPMVAQFAQRIGRSTNTVYNWLGQYAGYDSGRKARADKGSSRMPEEALVAIASMQRENTRETGKRVMPLPVAMNVADMNGITVNVSASQVARLLRERRMDARALKETRVTQDLRSLHPNHVHQIDPSLCLLYYMGGRQHMMTEKKFNKNKQEAYAKVKLKVWRYVRVDHFSGVVDVHYYEAAGENQAVLFDFLLHTWSKQDGRLNYGVPKMLLWDKGSANTSHAIQHLLDALDVHHETHAAGHAWAKGAVEQGNNLVETQFESRLKLEPVETVEELNAAAARWARDWNANLIKHVDSRLVRASGEPLVRDDLWSLILRTPGALVDMPPREVCQWFMAGQEKDRQVRNLQVSFAHPEIGRRAIYDLRAWAEHIHNGQRVAVAPVLLRDGLLRVTIDRVGAEPLTVEVEPQRDFGADGRSTDAQVLGEGYTRAPETAGEAVSRRLAAAAYGEGTTVDKAEQARDAGVRPFAEFNGGKGLVSHTPLGQEQAPARLLPAAGEVQTDAVRAARGAVRTVQVEPLSHIAAAKQLKAIVGDAWTSEHYAWMAQRYPAGVPEEALQGIADEIRTGRPMAPLRAVGGA